MADRSYENRVGQSGEGHAENPELRRGKIVLSPEELQVLKECNRESFWYRCVPLGVVFIGSTQMLVNRGFLKPNPRFGALFKNMAAGLTAFIVGKFSYQGQCREKILRLENSQLAQAIRQGKRGVELMSPLPESSEFDSESTSEHKTESRRPFGDYRDEGSSFERKGLDDSFRPSLDRETSYHRAPEERPVVQPGVSYDDLRQRNRVEYERRANSFKPSAVQTPTEPPVSSRQPGSGSSEEMSSWDPDAGSSRKGTRRDRFGNIID